MKARQDPQTVTHEGKPLQALIDGVIFRPASTQLDHRGALTEVFSLAWKFDGQPLCYVYQVLAKAGSIRAWVVHKKQNDRLFFSEGQFRVVLFDARPKSSTYRMLNELYFGELRPGLLKIPCGIYHGVQNVGIANARFINLPTTPYNHAKPDKYRLPINDKSIPYHFK